MGFNSGFKGLISALDMGKWTTRRPGCFNVGKGARYPLCRRLGGPQGRSGQVRKISPPPGIDPQTIHPVAKTMLYRATKKNQYEQFNYNNNNYYYYYYLLHHGREGKEDAHGKRGTSSSTSSHDGKKFRTRSMEKQRGVVFGFRKMATAVKNTGWMDGQTDR